MNADDIAVTGLGLNSAIGNDVTIACAAARAGIARPSELPFMVLDPTTGDTIPVTGHQAEISTKGFVGLSRLCRLGIPAIFDLIKDSQIDLQILNNTPIYLNIYERFLLDSASQQFDDEGFLPENITEDELNAIIEEDCKDRLISLLESGADIKFGSKAQLLFAGHDGVIRLIQKAAEELRSGTIERCIVGGIDSCLEQNKLHSLYALGLLFGGENNYGFIPGEAASLILLERIDAAKRRNARIQAIIGPIGIAYEKQHRFTKSLTNGTALAKTLQLALEQPIITKKEVQLVICDLNGDYWRAHEWGNALVKLKYDHGLRSAKLLYPAENFGEVSAAEAAVAICMGVRSFVRDYAKSESILIIASSYDGNKGALVIFDPKGCNT